MSKTDAEINVFEMHGLCASVSFKRIWFILIPAATTINR